MADILLDKRCTQVGRVCGGVVLGFIGRVGLGGCMADILLLLLDKRCTQVMRAGNVCNNTVGPGFVWGGAL
jgi:hypothetical protein